MMERKSNMIRPLGARCLIKLDESPVFSKGGLFLVDDAREKKVKGLVIATGPRVKEVKQGQTVVTAAYGGSDIMIRGVNCKLFEEKDIFAVVENS